MTIDHFKDAPDWADTVLFSEERNENVFAFTKIEAFTYNGKDNILKLLSWPDFAHSKHAPGRFKVVAKRDRDFSVIPKGIDKEIYDSVIISRFTSFILPIIIDGVQVNNYDVPNI